MKFTKLLRVKSSKIKTGFDIDKYFKDEAERKRIRKGMCRIKEERNKKHRSEKLRRKVGRMK